LKNIFLITPQTSEKHIHFIDGVSDGFIYMVELLAGVWAPKLVLD
jgi:tryptophan synthase alpha chain